MGRSVGEVKILGIESATGRAGVALGVDGVVIASTQVTRGPRHAEILVPSVQFVCGQSGIALDEIDAIAVDIGPGLFTGLRVGIATANGLAQALGKPMIGIPSLELVAHAMRHAASELVVVLDARRSEVYSARYAVTDGDLTVVTEPTVGPLAEVLAGVGTARLVDDELPSAEALVELAATREPVEASRIAPLYLRKSDAELNAERKGA